jgi:uncharacterized iron-regulated membrane protein
MTGWRRWVEHPEQSWLRNHLFQIHLMIGAAVSVYVALMSMSGIIIVWQNELHKTVPVEWLVKAHDNLLSGSSGRFVNGFGGVCLVTLCLTGGVIWWPGVKNWRRSVTVNWQGHIGRINWDLHSALGFWFYLFILMWGLSGIYFAFPSLINPLFRLDPADRYTDTAFFWLSEAHFGRFAWISKILWSIVGMVPAALAFTGVFICCRRMIYKKPSNPNIQRA